MIIDDAIDERVEQTHRDDQETGVPLLESPLGWRPDLVVAVDVGCDEAGAVLQQGEAGYPILVTTHALSGATAIQRLVRLATRAAPMYRVGDTVPQTLRVACACFQVVIQLGYAPQLCRTYVQQVCVIDSGRTSTGAGVSAEQEPRLLPLVEGMVDRSALDGQPVITWQCHGQISGDRRLMWSVPGGTTPPAIAARLADLPDAVWDTYCRDAFERPEGRKRGSQADAPPPHPLLVSAADALQAGAWQEAADRLDRAVRESDDPEVRTAIDTALAAHPGFREMIDQMITAACRAIRTALDEGAFDRAAELVRAPERHAVVERRREHHPDWLELRSEIEQRLAAVEACRHALTEAKVLQYHGDLRRALQTLEPIDASLVGSALGLVLLTARQRMLRHLVQQGKASDDDRAALAQVTREVAALHQEQLSDAGAAISMQPDVRGTTVATHPGDDRDLPEPPVLPAPRTDTTATEDATVVTEAPPMADPTVSGPPPTSGWLDDALARSRERVRLRHMAGWGSEQTQPTTVPMPPSGTG